MVSSNSKGVCNEIRREFYKEAIIRVCKCIVSILGIRLRASKILETLINNI